MHPTQLRQMHPTQLPDPCVMVISADCVLDSKIPFCSIDGNDKASLPVGQKASGPSLAPRTHPCIVLVYSFFPTDFTLIPLIFSIVYNYSSRWALEVVAQPH